MFEHPRSCVVVQVYAQQETRSVTECGSVAVLLVLSCPHLASSSLPPPCLPATEPPKAVRLLDKHLAQSGDFLSQALYTLFTLVGIYTLTQHPPSLGARGQNHCMKVAPCGQLLRCYCCRPCARCCIMGPPLSSLAYCADGDDDDDGVVGVV